MGLSSKQVSSDGNNWNNNNNQSFLDNATTTTTTTTTIKTLEFPKTPPMKTQQQQQQQQQLNCPRCDSTNTKFCYYNNYNKSQPRHFCKACKRHWTKGGTLRNVPVGGGRKNKRLKTSKIASKTTLSTTNTNLTLQTQQLCVTPSLGTSFPNNNNNNIIEDKTFSDSFYQTFLKQQQQQSSITFNNNDSFYLDSTIKTMSLGLSSQQNDTQDLQFHNYSNLRSNFESNPCSISSTITSIQTPNHHLYNFTSDLHANNNHQHHHDDDNQPWNMHTSSSSTRNNHHHNHDHDHHNNNNDNHSNVMSSNWGWDDFDKFVSVEPDLTTMPWDEIDTKL